MKSNVYRIIKNTYFQHGSVRISFYTVKTKTKFLFWEFWRPLYQESFDGKDEARFDTEGEAAIAIKRHQMGGPITGWVEEMVQEIDFNKRHE